MQSLSRYLARINLGVLVLVLFLSAAGLLMLYSAAGGAWRPWAWSQFVRFIPGFIVMMGLIFIPADWVFRGAYPFYGFCLLLLIAVEIMGSIGMGAQRWLSLGGLNLQPSELMKLGLILALARYFHRIHPNEKPGILYLLVPLGLMAVPAALILHQPNLGTTAILLMTGVMVCFAAGVRWIYFITAGIAGVVALPVAWQFLHDYQKQRVLTFLDPDKDPLGAGYNIIQSIIAIGSGGLFGQGYLHGSQGQLDFLPEKQTDFIFTMFAEEFGFIGALVLIICYVLLMVYGLVIAARCKHRFGSLIAAGISSLLFLHLFINMGMAMGMLPVVGVPLPLMSYGGSSLLTMLIGFGLLLYVWANRNEEFRRHSL